MMTNNIEWLTLQKKKKADKAWFCFLFGIGIAGMITSVLCHNLLATIWAACTTIAAYQWWQERREVRWLQEWELGRDLYERQKLNEQLEAEIQSKIKEAKITH